MAKENPQETRTSIDDLNDSLTGIGQKIQTNTKKLTWVGIIIAVILVCVFGYIYGVRQPGIKAANDAIGQADITLMQGNDSLALAQYQAVAADYGYAAGKRASLNAAIILYKEGKYQEALEAVSKFSADDHVISASAKSLEGDCLVNLGKYQEAIDCFAKAAQLSDNNPHYTPLFLMKQATVCRELKDYAKEAQLYQTILDEYPSYGANLNIDIEKYLDRAKIDAGQE